MSIARKKSQFITVEGIEGVGKSTAVNYIKAYLEKADISLVATREPGGTEIAETIRSVLLQDHTEDMAPMTELLLMFAGRAQHIGTVIQPALDAGQWVLCDRFTDASYAYQGGGRGMPRQWISSLETLVQETLQPDLTLLLDAPVALGLERARNRSKPDRFEQEKQDFFTRVRNEYLERAKQYPERYRLVDASQSLEDVTADIEAVLKEFLS